VKQRLLFFIAPMNNNVAVVIYIQDDAYIALHVSVSIVELHKVANI
jgi:hypothetical protein